MAERRKRTFDELLQMMARLRGPDGCPWDREQTHRSLARHVIEEAYEVVDAIEHGDDAHLREELGDLLLQIVFHAEIATEEERFTMSEILDDILTKLERRHPHIFGDVQVSGPAEVVANWEAIKRGEKEAARARAAAEAHATEECLEEEEGEGPGPAGVSALDGVPRSLPSLALADKLQSRAARTGFDWEQVADVADKMVEEARELAEARAAVESAAAPAAGSGAPAPGAAAQGDSARERIEDELGDLLFSAVNLARHLDVDPEIALRRVCDKFDRRFRVMEQIAEERGLDFQALALEDKDRLWEEAKKGLEGGPHGQDSQDES